MQTNHAVIRAIDLAGNLSRLAKMAGVKPSTAHEWKTGERHVPPRRCYLIETGLNGQVTRRQLRPHDWFDHWPDTPEAQEMRARAALETVAAGVSSVDAT